ncbi:MAG: hypothetical protein HYZ23_09645 [Chloroflexi bacterium]|nr:hypothetical protein [Chloroflexota bacterium]
MYNQGAAMIPFFSYATELSAGNSPSDAENYFRFSKKTGLLEQQYSPEETAVRIFANGTPCAAYMLKDGMTKPVPLAELEEPAGISAVELPHIAGRLAWLALESQSEKRSTIQNADAWVAQTDAWKHNRWNGMVEVVTKDARGLAFFWQGEFQKTDVIFSTPQGFTHDFPRMENGFAWEILLYPFNSTTHAGQCAVLRHGMMRWSQQVFAHYRDIVGVKLLRMMSRDLSRQIEPWDWNIALDETGMIDSHFFPYLNEAAQAYRAIFMSMGSLMNVVLGSNLTQMLLNDTFESAHPDERSILESQRLIPAAFTE